MSKNYILCMPGVDNEWEKTAFKIYSLIFVVLKFLTKESKKMRQKIFFSDLRDDFEGDDDYDLGMDMGEDFYDEQDDDVSPTDSDDDYYDYDDEEMYDEEDHYDDDDDEDDVDDDLDEEDDDEYHEVVRDVWSNMDWDKD